MGIDRRTFLRRSALTAGSLITAPYILPSGRAFAKTGQQVAEHVVVVLLAGGIRQQEAVLQRYLADSQGLNIEGNIMSNLLSGVAPDDKVVFGTSAAGSVPIPQILSTPLDQQGILLPEMRYSTAATGHYVGLSACVSGHYGATQGLQQRPLHPTMFEYLRRHAGAKATDTWFVGNGLTGSVPLLNHSGHSAYGAQYGANMFIPSVTFGNQGVMHAEGARVFHPDEELPAIEQMRQFLNQRFGESPDTDGPLDALGNTPEEKIEIKTFIRETFDRLDRGLVPFPPVTDNGDLVNVGFALEVMRYFQPKLTVINMSAADTCHNNFTNYLQAVHRADHGVGFLWNYIQNELPGMANNTALLVLPEHGRNLEPNNILDTNDWAAFDHDSDANSRRVFGMLAGPNIDAGLTLGGLGNPVGDTADAVLTVADILGIKPEVEAAGLVNAAGRSWLDRM